MTAVTLTRWGNSLGVRIPVSFLKKTKAYVGERFELNAKKNGTLTLTPLNFPQEGWLEAFNAAADANHDELLLTNVEHSFDQDEWKW